MHLEYDDVLHGGYCWNDLTFWIFDAISSISLFRSCSLCIFRFQSYFFLIVQSSSFQSARLLLTYRAVDEPYPRPSEGLLVCLVEEIHDHLLDMTRSILLKIVNITRTMILIASDTLDLPVKRDIGALGGGFSEEIFSTTWQQHHRQLHESSSLLLHIDGSTGSAISTDSGFSFPLFNFGQIDLVVQELVFEFLFKSTQVWL